LIQGILLKCVDGKWTDGDGLTPPAEMLVIGITRALLCRDQENKWLDWEIEEPDKPLADPDELNASIPKQEWGVDFNGEPRPPWSLNFVVCLLDPDTASTYTFINSTLGARIGFERLEDRIKWMRTLRGNNVAPIVKLDSRPMKLKKAGVVKQRPEFTVSEWRDLGVGINQSATPQIEHKAEPEVEPAPTESTKKKANTTVGKPVKPTTIQEEIDDDLPDNLKAPTNILKAG
jgi:hypothetical protein